MNIKEIKEMIQLMNENGLSEFEMEQEGLKVRLKKSSSGAIESTLESFSLTPLMSSVFSPSLDVDAITDLPEVALKPLTQAK